MWPYVKPVWFRALCSMLICIPIGSLDAVIALALKLYMDLVMVEKSITSPWYIPLGTIPAIEMESYGELRNRSCSDGTEWLNSKTKEFFNSKLSEMNFNPIKLEKYGY